MADFRNSIGAFWLKESRDGKKYMTGDITIDGRKIKVVMFSNKKRPDKKDPDYRLFLSEERGAGGGRDDGYSGQQSGDDDSTPF